MCTVKEGNLGGTLEKNKNDPRSGYFQIKKRKAKNKDLATCLQDVQPPKILDSTTSIHKVAEHQIKSNSMLMENFKTRGSS